MLPIAGSTQTANNKCSLCNLDFDSDDRLAFRCGDAFHLYCIQNNLIRQMLYRQPKKSDLPPGYIPNVSDARIVVKNLLSFNCTVCPTCGQTPVVGEVDTYYHKIFRTEVEKCTNEAFRRIQKLQS